MKIFLAGALLVLTCLLKPMAIAQTPPSAHEIANYRGLHAAAHRNDVASLRALIASGADPNARDKRGRTPVHVAAHSSAYGAFRALVAGGANVNAFDSDRYDAITIAAVKNDVRLVGLAIELGGNPKAATSPYSGTALIAAAHLGHVEVVKMLISAKAPLDHVNNLGWTALIEAVILGDGGRRHIETVRALVGAGANKSLADRNGITPLQHAKNRGYEPIIAILR